MASFINSTAQFINDAYDYYLWTLSLAGNLLQHSTLDQKFCDILQLFAFK